MDGDNLAYLTVDGGQNKIGAMIDIYLAREKSCGDRQSPAIPENVEIAVGNNNAASPYILRLRKLVLPCGASTGEQGVLVPGVLREYGIHKTADIVPYSRPLPDGRRIINRNAHGKYLAYPILAASLICGLRANGSA